MIREVFYNPEFQIKISSFLAFLAFLYFLMTCFIYLFILPQEHIFQRSEGNLTGPEPGPGFPLTSFLPPLLLIFTSLLTVSAPWAQAPRAPCHVSDFAGSVGLLCVYTRSSLCSCLVPVLLLRLRDVHAILWQICPECLVRARPSLHWEHDSEENSFLSSIALSF